MKSFSVAVRPTYQVSVRLVVGCRQSVFPALDGPFDEGFTGMVAKMTTLEEGLTFFHFTSRSVPARSWIDSQINIEFGSVLHPSEFMVIFEGGADIQVAGHLLNLQNVSSLAALYYQRYCRVF